MSDDPSVQKQGDSDPPALEPWQLRERAREAFDRRLMWSSLVAYFIAWAAIPAANAYWKQYIEPDKLLQLFAVTVMVAAVYVHGHVVAIRTIGRCYLEADRIAIGRALVAGIIGIAVAHPATFGMLADNWQWYSLLTGFFFAWIAGHVLAIAYSALATWLFNPR